MKSAIFKLLVVNSILLSINISHGYTCWNNEEKDNPDKLYKIIPNPNNNLGMVEVTEFVQLPFESWKHVLSFVDTNQLKSLRPVSWTFSYIIQTDNIHPLTLVLNSESDFTLYLSHTTDYAPRHIKIRFMVNTIDLFIHSKLANIMSLDFRPNLESHTSIGPIAVQALAAGQWPNLTTLNLNHNGIRDAVAIALAQGNLNNLTILDLQLNQIGDTGTASLAQGHLTHLTTLDLYRNQIGDAGATGLAQGNLNNLTTLNLESNQIGEIGAKAIAQGTLTNLTKLYLYGNEIGDTAKSLLQEKIEVVSFRLLY